MSSLRNAVKRVTHKERSQPHHRRKLGLLEKHSDYVERATDYKKKKNAINNLKVKANERNPVLHILCIKYICDIVYLLIFLRTGMVKS